MIEVSWEKLTTCRQVPIISPPIKLVLGVQNKRQLHQIVLLVNTGGKGSVLQLSLVTDGLNNYVDAIVCENDEL